MALVPAPAQFLAPGSVRYDPPHQPKIKTLNQITRLIREVNTFIKYDPLKRHF